MYLSSVAKNVRQKYTIYTGFVIFFVITNDRCCLINSVVKHFSCLFPCYRTIRLKLAITYTTYNA